MRMTTSGQGANSLPLLLSWPYLFVSGCRYPEYILGSLPHMNGFALRRYTCTLQLLRSIKKRAVHTMVASQGSTLGKQAVLSIALCSPSALGQVVGPSANLVGADSKWGVDIWQGAEYEATAYVLHLHDHLILDFSYLRGV